MPADRNALTLAFAELRRPGLNFMQSFARKKLLDQGASMTAATESARGGGNAFEQMAIDRRLDEDRRRRPEGSMRAPTESPTRPEFRRVGRNTPAGRAARALLGPGLDYLG